MLTLLGVGQGQINTTYDADYQAVLDRGVALGYTLPTLYQRVLQNKLVIDLKAAGVWAKLDKFYNFANNGSKEFATLNWKAPTLTQCTLFNSITFTSNQGFTGNGTNMYIDTNFQLASGVNYSLNNASRYVFMYNASGNGPFDGNSAASTNTIRRLNTSAQRINQGANGVSPIFDYNSTSGLKSIHRTSVTSITLFNDDVSETRTISSTGPIAAANHLLLRTQTTYGAHTLSMFAAGASLVSENTAFMNAYYSYISSIIQTP
jgi:hypothetical protein